MKYGFGKNYGTFQEEYPVADTVYGKVQGENRDGIAVFRGIPYGGRCDGERRFLAPQKPEKWEGIRDCRKNGYYAPQFGTSISGSDIFGPFFSGGSPEKFGCEGEEQNENCLVLNVVTPGCDEKKRPVAVYIHGGGFATGSGTLVLGADRWVREEDFVLVGVNHRLNIFGCFYLGELDDRYRDSGMAGILDLILALRWVQRNIRYFGGDPDNVTIMGESGGGVKVSTLLAMEEARGLFKRAIVESGSMAVGLKSRQEGTRQARAMLKALQIPEDHLELLERKSCKEFLDAMKKAGLMEAMDFQPVADGIHLLQMDGYTAPEGSEEVELLVGASEDEMAAFLDPEILKKISWENIIEYLYNERYILEPLYRLDKDKLQMVVEAFRRSDRKQDDPGHLFAKICSQVSFLGGGAYYQAIKKVQQEGKVYCYAVSYDAPHPKEPGKKYAWHTADLPLQMRIVLHPECEEVSRYMAHAWAAFIRCGNPSTEEIEWEPFSAEEKKVMVIDKRRRMEKDPWGEVRMALEKASRWFPEI